MDSEGLAWERYSDANSQRQQASFEKYHNIVLTNAEPNGKVVSDLASVTELS